jgi:rhombotail lipoprotein
MKITISKAITTAVLALFLASCASLGSETRRGVSSSLVDYLYPDGEVPERHTETTPNLRLPLTVGLAFVPAQGRTSYSLPEAKKALLLEEVKQEFIDLDYVQEINIIPETYMRSSRGFEGVGQIARLYGLDVVALVSYDQVTVTSENEASLLYWTIVGAYVIPGNVNQATTFVDTAVFDVRSRKMLFRAPGVSDIEQSSTLVGVRREKRDTQERGFEVAMADMTQNLSAELDRFKARIKEDNSVQITHRQGYGGGGGVQWPFLVLLGGMAILAASRR